MTSATQTISWATVQSFGLDVGTHTIGLQVRDSHGATGVATSTTMPTSIGIIRTIFTSSGGSPAGAVVNAAGDVYVAEFTHNRVIKIDPSGNVTVVAGNGSADYTGDGLLANDPGVSLHGPEGLALDAAGNLYIADYLNNVIRMVDTSGYISTVPGAGLGANLNGPVGVAVTPDGSTLYIADSGHHVVLRLQGASLTTVAGTFGIPGYDGDGGDATAALLNSPDNVALYGNSLYIIDENATLRKVDLTTNIITAVAGTGIPGYNGDAIPANTAQLSEPTDVVVDGSGNIFIADYNNQRIRKIDATTGYISTVAGTGISDFNGDNGIATSIDLIKPIAVAVDGNGNIYIADTSNQRVREVSYVSLTQSTVSVPATPVASGSGTTVTFTAIDSNGAQENHGGLSVVFSLGAGAASGTFSGVADHGDGTYTANFYPDLAGSNTITATVDGVALLSTPANVTVAPSVTSIYAFPNPVTDATVGNATFNVTVVFTQPMDTVSGGRATAFAPRG